MTEPTKIKLAILVLLGALFAPIAAQAGGVPTTVSSAGTVTLNMNSTPCTDTSTATSVQAASVVLPVDTASAIVNSETSTYVYFSETDTALWGATWDYGSTQDANTCAYRDMSGTVSLTRGRFMTIYGGGALSETNTNTTDFEQYVGNIESSGTYSGNACGNMNASPRNTANVTTSCTTAIRGAGYQLLTYANTVQVRGGIAVKKGTLGAAAGTIYTHVRVKKSAIVGAPLGTTWVATETFTVTSA